MDTTRKNAPPIAPVGLYWSERGAVCCRDHIPHPGSDTWRWERWTPMLVEDATLWQDEFGELPRCECCGFTADVEPF